ncbi:MAG: hypothetical protein WCS96_12790, partial [Victivallales bacterium]
FVRSTLLDSEPKVKSALTDLMMYYTPALFSRKCVVGADGKVVDFPLAHQSVIDWDKLREVQEIPVGTPSGWIEITEQIYAPLPLNSGWSLKSRDHAAQTLFMGFFARENDSRKDRRPIFKGLELGNLKKVHARLDFATRPEEAAIVRSVEYSSGNSCIPVLLEPTGKDLSTWGESILTLRDNTEKRMESLKEAGISAMPPPKRIIISRWFWTGYFYPVLDPDTIAKEVEVCKLIGISSINWWCPTFPDDYESYATAVQGLSPLFKEGTRPDWLAKDPWDPEFEQKVAKAAAKIKIPQGKKMLMKFGDETKILPEKILTESPRALPKFREYLAACDVKPEEIGCASLAEADLITSPANLKTTEERFLYLNTMLFRSDMMINWYKRMTTGMKKGLGSNLITTGASCWDDAGNAPDFFKQAKAGVFDVDSHEFSTLLWVMPYGAIYRAVALRTAGRYTSTLPGITYGSTRGGEGLADIIELDGTTALINGMRHIYWYVAGPYNQLGPVPLAFERRFALISQRAARLEDWIIYGDSPSRAPRTALVKSYTSEIWGGGVRLPYFQEFEVAAAALAWNQIPFDIIPDEWIPETLKNYDVLYLAMPNLPVAVRPAIADWVKAGGRLVIIGKAASLNEKNDSASFYAVLGGDGKTTSGTVATPLGKGQLILIADELGMKIRQSLIPPPPPLDENSRINSVFHGLDESLVKRYLAPFDIEPKLPRPILVSRIGVDATFFEKENRESAVILLADYTDGAEKKVSLSLATAGTYNRCEDESGRRYPVRREKGRTIIENVPLSVSTVLTLL